ncbi:MAG: pyridoxamine 5'-phosphate oxidase family protein [Hassallia sp.]
MAGLQDSDGQRILSSFSTEHLTHFLLPVPIRFVVLMHRIGGKILVSFEFWMIAPSAFCDYAGNSMFNTVGNFVENPHAGLIFLDFERDVSVQIIGRPEILWELDDLTNETNGTRRYWTLFLEQWLELSLPQSFRWELLDYSLLQSVLGCLQ